MIPNVGLHFPLLGAVSAAATFAGLHTFELNFYAEYQL